MIDIDKIIQNKHKREQQIKKCSICEWGMKQDGIIVCPFVGCIKRV
mgnify:FL=1